MTSSESMDDDSFRSRVDKIFGSLTSSSSTQQHSSCWSLTDNEVERKVWRRDTTSSFRDELPSSSSFDQLKKDRRRNFRRQLQDDDDDDDHDVDDDGEESNPSPRGVSDNGIDEWDIRSSIGLDRTLDNEEEEDEFDKVASGREGAGERLYMKDVTSQQSYLNFHNVVSNSLRSTRDPRANHLAAKIRLKEDEDDAQKIKFHNDTDHAQVRKRPMTLSDEDGGTLRSILKRKDNNSDSKSLKRVRFDPGCKISWEEEASEKIDPYSPNIVISESGSMSSKSPSELPDYLQNPSKYTCYSFDSSSELDEKSNSQASMDFLMLLRSSKATKLESGQGDDSAYLPKSVTFIPKRKTGEFEPISRESQVKQNTEDEGDQAMHHTGFFVGIAASESQEANKLVEDEAETNGVDGRTGFRKCSRRYRVKSCSDDVES